MAKASDWTAEETQRLREQWPNFNVADFPGRNEKGIRIRASRVGIATPKQTPQKPWTKEEDDFITANVDKPWGWVALKLNRTVVSVRSRCARLRAVKKKLVRLNGATDEDILALHAQGLSNHKIAPRLGISTECVRKNLRRLNLESRERDMQAATVVREKTMLLKYGVKNVGEISHERHLAYSASLGWPDLPPTQAAIMEFVYQNPLVSYRELSQASGSRRQIHNHTVALCNRGMLIKSPPFFGRAPVYSLSPEAHQIKSEFLARSSHAT